MRQEQARQAQETAATFAQFQTRQDEFQQQQQLAIQQQTQALQQQQQAMHQQQILMQQQLLGFMQHVVTAIGAPPPQPTPQLGQPATTLMTPALQPSGLQSQG